VPRRGPAAIPTRYEKSDCLLYTAQCVRTAATGLSPIRHGQIPARGVGSLTCFYANRLIGIERFIGNSGTRDKRSPLPPSSMSNSLRGRSRNQKFIGKYLGDNMELATLAKTTSLQRRSTAAERRTGFFSMPACYKTRCAYPNFTLRSIKPVELILTNGKNGSILLLSLRLLTG